MMIFHINLSIFRFSPQPAMRGESSSLKSCEAVSATGIKEVAPNVEGTSELVDEGSQPSEAEHSMRPDEVLPPSNITEAPIPDLSPGFSADPQERPPTQIGPLAPL